VRLIGVGYPEKAIRVWSKKLMREVKREKENRFRKWSYRWTTTFLNLISLVGSVFLEITDPILWNSDV
jgi:hypothetical protein